MVQLLRCKSCGFIIAENKAGEVCPACGVPRKMLEPFTDTVSEKRRKILKLDIHPIVVHFPEAFSLSCLVFAVAAVIFSGVLGEVVLCALKVIGVLLPVVVLAAFLTGLLDGKTRFRKVTTPILKKKIWLGSIFFLSSAAVCVIILGTGLSASGLIYGIIALSAVSFTSSLFLGLFGSRIKNAMFPG